MPTVRLRLLSSVMVAAKVTKSEGALLELPMM